MTNEDFFKKAFLDSVRAAQRQQVSGPQENNHLIILADARRIRGEGCLEKKAIQHSAGNEVDIITILRKATEQLYEPQGYLFCSTTASLTDIEEALTSIFLTEHIISHAQERQNAIMKYLQAKRAGNTQPPSAIPLLQGRETLEEEEPVFYGGTFPAYNPKV